MGVSSPLCDMTGISCISTTRVQPAILKATTGKGGEAFDIHNLFMGLNSIVLKMRLNIIYFIEELALALALNIPTCGNPS